MWCCSRHCGTGWDTRNGGEGPGMRGGAGAHMPMRMLWMIWKMADPQTTKMNSASSQGPTDAFSSGAVLEVLATFPRCVMFLLCFSLAMRMRCLATMVRPRRAGPGPLRSAPLRSALCAASAPRGAARRKPSLRAPPAANPCRPPAALPGRRAEAASPRHVTGGASRAARRGAPRSGRAAAHPEVEVPPKWRRPRRCWQ